MTNPSTASPRILVVEDDVALAEMLRIVLSSEGYQSAWCPDGTSAMDVFRSYRPDLVLLDLMLPGRDGVEISRDIRKESGVPIVMLTARGDTSDVVLGFESGADDYIAKPFETAELLARIRTRLARRQIDADSDGMTYIVDLTIDEQRHVVRRGNEVLPVTPLEYDLLLTFARNPRKALTREELLRQVWGYRHSGDVRLVNVHIQRLRSKIEKDPDNPEVVLTVRGVGYRAGDPLPVR